MKSARRFFLRLWLSGLLALFLVATQVVAAGTSVVRAGNLVLQESGSGFVVVTLEAQGSESALGFSLSFDPTLLRFTGFTLASGAPPGLQIVNANPNQAANGQVAVLLGMNLAGSLPVGTVPLVSVGFTSLQGSDGKSTTISFGDQPVLRQIYDASPKAISGTYVNATVTISRSVTTLEDTTYTFTAAHFGVTAPAVLTATTTLGTLNPVSELVTSRFVVGDNLNGLVFNDADAEYGPTLFYSIRRGAAGNSVFTTISTLTPVTEGTTDRFSLGTRDYDALTYAAPALGIAGPISFYYLRHDSAGASFIGYIHAPSGGFHADFFRDSIGSNFAALTFAAPNAAAVGANLFYYLRHDNAGHSWFGYINPGAASGAVAAHDLYDLGLNLNFDALAFVEPDLAGAGGNLFYYLRHDTNGDAWFGAINPSAGFAGARAVDQFKLPANRRYRELAFATTAVGYGANLFYFLQTVSGANASVAVKIVALPLIGSLRLNGVAVVADQLVSVETIMARKLTFVPVTDGNGNPYASFTFQAPANGEVGLDPTPRTMTINVMPVNDAPVLAGIEANPVGYTEKSPGIPMTTALSVNDKDSVTLVGAIVQITGNYIQGQDVLDFADMGAIAGSFSPSSGTLTLAGSDTVGRYQEALQSVKYRNTSNNPSVLQRLVSFQIVDGAGENHLSDMATRSIGITAVNDAPVANAPSVATDEDTPKNITLTGSDVEGSPLIFTVVGNPAKGTLSGTTPNLTYTPHLNVNGADSFTFRVGDGALDSAVATINITINPVNDAPVSLADTFTVNEDNPLTLLAPGVLGNDTDPDPDVLTANLVSQPAHGSVVLNTNGSFAYVPSLNFNGTDSFTYKANDGKLDSTVATVTINVTPVNDAPTMTSIANRTIDEGSTLAFTASAVDPDGPSQTLTFSLVGTDAPTGASINSTSGVFTWTPTEAHGLGRFTITVRVTDNGSPNLSVTGSFTVNASEINSEPTLAPIGNQTVTEGSLLSVTASGSDTDVPANTLTYSLEGAPPGMMIDPSSGLIAWIPTETQGPGSYSVTLRLRDNGSPALSAARAFSISVQESNSAPTLSSIPDQRVKEGDTLTVALAGSDTDVPTNSLAYRLGSGMPEGSRIDPTSGVFVWTPSEMQGPGSYTVRVELQDSGSPPLMSNLDFVVAVEEVNTAPVLPSFGIQAANEGQLLSVLLAAFDRDLPANTQRFRLGSNAPAGVTIDPASGTLSWTPTEVQGPGTYSIPFEVTDDGQPPLSTSGSVTVQVREVNRAPVLAALPPLTIPATGFLQVQVQATDPDVPANILTYNLRPDSPAGAAINAATGVITWAPDFASPGGIVALSVVVQDNGTPPLQDQKSLVVTILSVNIAPSFPEGLDQVTLEDGGPQSRANWATAMSAGPVGEAEQTLIFQVDNDNRALFFTQPAISPSGALTYTTAPDAFGSATVTVRLQDNGGTANGGSDTSPARTFDIIVTPVNDAPTLDAAADQTVPEDSRSQTVILSGITGGPSNEIQSLNVSATSSNPGLIPNPAVRYASPQRTATLTFTPTASAVGTATITVVVIDGGNTANGGINTVTRRFQVTVTPINRPPTLAGALSDQTVVVGSPVNWGIVVGGTPPPSLQWFFNGSALAEAKAATLALGPAEISHAGRYRLVARNEAGEVSSREAVLTVLAPVQVAGGADDLVVAVGEAVRMEVKATGTAPLTYDWFFNGSRVAGFGGSQLFLSAVQVSDAGRYSAVVRNAAGAVAGPSFNLTVIESIRIVRQPQSLAAKQGEEARFTVEAAGTGPFRYQWELDGTAFRKISQPVLILAGVQGNAAGRYRVKVSNAVGAVTSQEAELKVNAPPRVKGLPRVVRVPRSTDVILEASAEGLAPFIFQWQLNGVNIPGANTGTYMIRNAQPSDGGTYTLAVQDAGGATTSDLTSVIVITPTLPFADSVANATPLQGASGEGSGNNIGFSSPGNAPARAAGQAGLRTAWMAWASPGNGVAHFSTRGSGFDTMLTVFSGSLGNLQQVASDEESGGFSTSELSFNTAMSQTYNIAVSGFEGAQGEIALRWTWEPTSEPLPVITTQPSSFTVLLGQPVEFSAQAQSPGGSALSYQWLLDGDPIPGATSPSLRLPSVREDQVGNYRVRVANPGGSTISEVAILQVNLLATGLEGPGIAAVDKVGSSSQTGQQVLLGDAGPDGFGSLESGRVATKSSRPARLQAPAPMEGYRGDKIFSTKNAAKDIGEPNHGRVLGGASTWFVYEAVTNGVIRVSTEGSDYDTVLAVYTSAETIVDYRTLSEVASNDNSGADGKTSVVQFPAVRGTKYYLVVDGVNASKGRARLRYELATPPMLPRGPTWSRFNGASEQPMADATNPPVGLNESVRWTIGVVQPYAPADLAYQWRRNGLDLSAATNATLTLTNMTLREAGQYSVAVDNFAGSTLSVLTKLGLREPVRLLEELRDQSQNSSGDAIFSAVPEGPGPFRYRWTFNGTEMAGATNATLRLASLTGAQAGDYTVEVITEFGIAMSRARLTVSQPSILPSPIRIGRMERLAQDRVRLAVDGENGLACLIRVSDDLVQWKDLVRATISSRQLEFVDPEARQISQRFYQVVFEP